MAINRFEVYLANPLAPIMLRNKQPDGSPSCEPDRPTSSAGGHLGRSC